MVMMNEEGDRGGICNVNGGGRGRYHELDDIDFPPGYRFEPTDQELIKEYLYRKVHALQLPLNRFEDVNIYSYDPWKLAARFKSYGERVHYFFTPREKKYPNGGRPNRAAGVGYWKACGADKPIYDEVTNKEIGFKRVLVFYRGKPVIGKKLDWIMHEYTLAKPKPKEEKKKDTSSSSSTTTTTKDKSRRKNKRPCPYSGNPKDKQLDEFVLCKLYLKANSKKDMKDPDYDDPYEDIKEENEDVATSSVAAATLPEDQHHMYQTASSVAAATLPEDQHHMHQTTVIDHRYSFTSMVPAMELEIMPLNNEYCYPENVNDYSLGAAASSPILPSVNSDDYAWDLFVAEMNNYESRSDVLGSSVGFSTAPNTDISRG